MRNWSNQTYKQLTDFCWILISVIVIGMALWWLMQRPIFWLKGIDVSIVGNDSVVSAYSITKRLKNRIRGTYFTVDISEIRDALIDIPWVKNVSVTRIWPNRIAIELTLHKAIALWGEGEVLTEDGSIFHTNTAIADSEDSLPLLIGSKEKAQIIYERYKLLEEVCSKQGFVAKSLEFNEFGGWILNVRRQSGSPLSIVFGTYETTVGMESKLNRILFELPSIQSYLGSEPQRIDARYDRGVAIKRSQQLEVKESVGEK